VFDAGPALEKTMWNGLITRIICVKRSTLTRRAKDGMWQRREETSFYACSAPLSAEMAANAIRSHWAIENQNHYVRDVAMREDASRIRINPGIFARARSFALNILRANGEKNITDALWRNAININRPLQYRFM
jgi:predicted transposase YbfD/YdcC